jgi:hypothetical protein
MSIKVILFIINLMWMDVVGIKGVKKKIEIDKKGKKNI